MQDFVHQQYGAFRSWEGFRGSQGLGFEFRTWGTAYLSKWQSSVGGSYMQGPTVWVVLLIHGPWYHLSGETQAVLETYGQGSTCRDGPNALPIGPKVVPFWDYLTVNPRKLEDGFRRICARIPYTLP